MTMYDVTTFPVWKIKMIQNSIDANLNTECHQ